MSRLQVRLHSDQWVSSQLSGEDALEVVSLLERGYKVSNKYDQEYRLAPREVCYETRSNRIHDWKPIKPGLDDELIALLNRYPYHTIKFESPYNWTEFRRVEK